MSNGNDVTPGTHREEPRRGTHPPIVGREPDTTGGGHDEAELRADGGELEDEAEDADAPEASRNGTGEDVERALSDMGFEVVLDHLDAAVFTLDDGGDVVSWNRAAEALTGVPSEEAKAVDAVSRAFYHDGRRAKTLADKVLAAPETADEEFGVERVEDVGYTLYSDRSEMTDGHGDRRHIEFSAAPLYQGDDLVGVVEIVEDRTEDVRRQEQLHALLTEVQSTMEAIGDGRLEERAAFEGGDDLGDDLLSFVDVVNRMGESLERTFEEVGRHTEDLRSTAGAVAGNSDEINDVASEQVEEITAVATEVADMSATVEEIAATAENVEETSSEAADVAEEGYGAAEDAVDEMQDVADAAKDVATDVDELQRRVEEIDEIVEVINDIADQTNLLALNASIEAARAGEAGEGFAVVADEVKNLAEESQQQAGQIERTVQAIQDDTADTVDSLEEMNDNVDSGIDQVEGAMLNFEEIVDLVKETETGITEVANATDDQAASTEEMATMVNEAVGKADAISKQAGEIATLSDEQKAKVEETNAVVREFAGDAIDGEVVTATDGGRDR